MPYPPHPAGMHREPSRPLCQHRLGQGSWHIGAKVGQPSLWVLPCRNPEGDWIPSVCSSDCRSTECAGNFQCSGVPGDSEETWPPSRTPELVREMAFNRVQGCNYCRNRVPQWKVQPGWWVLASGRTKASLSVEKYWVSSLSYVYHPSFIPIVNVSYYVEMNTVYPSPALPMPNNPLRLAWSGRVCCQDQWWGGQTSQADPTGRVRDGQGGWCGQPAKSVPCDWNK